MINDRIGVFDSGLGGLTVLKELMQRFPAHYMYIGDTANLPYGAKTPEEIIKFSHQIVSHFDSNNIKTCIIACHTASTIALESLRSSFAHMNIIGVAGQVCDHAIAKTHNKRIGILATMATIANHGHKNYINHIDPEIAVIEQACPELVPAIESQIFQEAIINNLIAEYVTPLLEQKIDTIILGSTHYALIKNLIQTYVGPGIFLASAEDNLKPFVSTQSTEIMYSLSLKTTSEPSLFWQRARNLTGLELPPIELISW